MVWTPISCVSGVPDGAPRLPFRVWCAARRLNAGHFAWPHEAAASPLSLTQSQFDALVVGLPWQRLPEMSVITRM